MPQNEEANRSGVPPSTANPEIQTSQDFLSVQLNMRRRTTMKRIIQLAVLSLVLVFGLMACSPAASELECTDDLGCVEVGPDEAVNIAYMLTISGPTAFLGEDSRGGIEIAIDDYGDLLGHSINLIGEDSMCNAEGGQAAAQRVASNDTILGAIGTSCSSAGEAALPIISSANMVMISPPTRPLP
jgi:ABC-type branched-subunit amino acid transport system substrate-binding protein